MMSMTTMKKKKNRTISSLFSLLPEEIIIDEILLSLPMNSLLQLRCVSKYFRSLITSHSFVKRHQDHNPTTDALLLITHRRDTGRRRDTEVFQHYSCNFSSSNDQKLEVVEMHCPFESVGIYGSCNGLLFLHGTKESNMKRCYIWNPCTKEYKELLVPPSMDEQHPFGRIEVTSRRNMIMSMSSSGFCGFSYDRSNDEYKILYHENRVGHLPDDVIRRKASLVSVTEFKLYTLGSDTWKNITDNPYGHLFFGSQWKNTTGILVNGALHWTMSSVPSSTSSSAKNAKIISFDMEKEEFRELQKPPCYSTRSPEEEYYYGELQVLQECLCLCQCPKSNLKKTMEIWMLKDYTVKDSWTKLFTISSPDDSLALKYLKLLRFVEDGVYVMLRDEPYRRLLVYECVNGYRSRLAENIDEFTQNRWTHGVIYKESLVPLNSGAYTKMLS